MRRKEICALYQPVPDLEFHRYVQNGFHPNNSIDNTIVQLFPFPTSGVIFPSPDRLQEKQVFVRAVAPRKIENREFGENRSMRIEASE
jgi:hypothetical protein